MEEYISPVPWWEYSQIQWPFCWFGGRISQFRNYKTCSGWDFSVASQTSERWHDVPHGVACGGRQEEGVRRGKEVPPWPTASALLAGRWTLKATSSPTGTFLDPLEATLLAPLATLPQHGPCVLLLQTLLPITHGPVQCPHGLHQGVFIHSLPSLDAKWHELHQPLTSKESSRSLHPASPQECRQPIYLLLLVLCIFLGVNQVSPHKSALPQLQQCTSSSLNNPLGVTRHQGTSEGVEVHIMATVLTQENPPETNTNL